MGFLTKFSMKNTVVILLTALMITLGGLYSASQMKSESLPDIEVPIMWMTGIYPGAGPHDVSREVSEPLEKALQGIEGMDSITSYSGQNAGTVVMYFNYSADLEKAKQDINNAIAKVNLPANVEKPELHLASVNDPDIISFTLAGSGSQAEAMQFVKDVVKPQLANVNGVEDVTIRGEAEKKIFVRLLPEKLKEYQLSSESVKQALQAGNISIPAGEITVADKMMPVEVKKEIASVEELKKMRLFTLDQSKGIKDAMEAIGGGFTDIGEAMGEMAKGMQQGFSQLGEAQKGQMQLLGNIQLLTLAIAADQQELMTLASNPTPTPQDQARLAYLQKDMAAKQGILRNLAGQLQKVLGSLDKVSASGGNKKFSTSKDKNSDVDDVDMTPAVKTLTLGDIAEVSYGYAKEGSLIRTNGEEGVVFSISRQSGANVVEISKEVHDRLKKVDLPKGYKFKELFDYAIPIKQSVESMVREGLLGALFAIMVTFVFLRNIRATIVAVISIPLSIMAAFIVIAKLGYTINIMTLSGMAVAVGRVVDDSIVVIENIYRRVRMADEGERNAKLVYEAATEVGGAITSSTLTTIAVFGPLAFVSGIVGKVFVPFAITVVVALAFSLLVAITVVPLMGRLLLLKLQPEEEKEGALRQAYARMLNWSLDHKFIIIALSVLMLVGSVALVPKIGTNFMPQDKVRYYRVNISMPVGASLEKTDGISRQVEAIASKEKGVDIYQATVNSDGSAGVFIRIKDSIEDPKAVADSLRKQIKSIGGAKAISMQEIGGPGGSPVIEIQVNGKDFDTIKKAGQQISDALAAKVKGLADVSSNIQDVKPQVVVQVDEAKATAKGLNPLMVGGLLREMITGSKVTSMAINGQDTDVEVSFKTNDLTSLEKIKDLELMSMTGAKVKVREVAEVREQPGPSSIQRKNLKEFATVTGLITSSNSGQVSKDVEKVLKGLDLPDGVTWSMEGNTKMMSDGFRDMGIAMAIAIVLVFLVMIAAFGGAMAPFSILFSLPLALIGALLGLLVTGEQLGMPAMIGGLMLIGIVVTNAIVLVDRVQKQRRDGMELREALLEAGKTRVRPIFMTAIATIFALVPLAVMPAEGALISKSMAVVVIGGLTTSTLLTLIVVPVVYSILEYLTIKVFKVDPWAKINL